MFNFLCQALCTVYKNMPGVFHHSSNNRMQYMLGHLLKRLEALGENESEKKFREKMEHNMCDEKKYHFRNKLVTILLHHPDSDSSSDSSSDSDSLCSDCHSDSDSLCSECHSDSDSLCSDCHSDSDSLCSDCLSDSDSGYESDSSLSSVLSSISRNVESPREFMVEMVSPRSRADMFSSGSDSGMFSSGSDSGMFSSDVSSDSDSGMENNIRIENVKPIFQGARLMHQSSNVNR